MLIYGLHVLGMLIYGLHVLGMLLYDDVIICSSLSSFFSGGGCPSTFIKVGHMTGMKGSFGLLFSIYYNDISFIIAESKWNCIHCARAF